MKQTIRNLAKTLKNRDTHNFKKKKLFKGDN